MLIRRRQGLEVLSISALDLFASALGVFILITIMLFPYYLRQPSVEVELQGAQAELSAAGRSLSEAERDAEDTERLKASAAAALAEARERLARAEAAEAEARAASPIELTQGVVPTNALDVVFALDTTGSMGRVIRDVQATLVSVIRILHRLTPDLRIGFVAFKDHGDVYVTLPFPLRPMDDANIQELVRFVRGLSAEGGGDIPEAVDEALHAAVSMAWRDDAQGQIIVIGDAHAHLPNWQRAFELATGFRDSAPPGGPPRTVSTVLTGRDPTAQTFFERVAMAGGGEFTRHQGQMIESVLLAVLRNTDEEVRM